MQRDYEPLSRETERVARAAVDAAIAVHRKLGPGLLESVYEVCLGHELEQRGCRGVRQVPQPVVYDSVRLELDIASI